MADYNYSLHLYSSVIDGQTYRQDITNIAQNWRRSIRINGGYWQGSFQIRDQPISVLQQLFFESKGDYFCEKTGGDITWEGMVYEMALDDRGAKPTLDVTVCGYVFTANWKIVSVGDGAVGAASTWISDIVGTDMQFLSAGRIDSNPLEVYRETEIEQLAFDEVMKIVDLGDQYAMPWCAWVGEGRRINYNAIVSTPQYKVISGMKRRWSFDDMWNAVRGSYTNDAGKARTITEAENTTASGRYGKRVNPIHLDSVTEAAANATRDRILKESAYPRSRTVGSSGDIEITSLSGEAMEFSQWRLWPGVYKDAQAPDRVGAAATSTDWLLDEGEFLVDEVEVSADGGISLRTVYFDEADILEAQDEYQEEYGDDIEKYKKQQKRKDKEK